MICCRLVRFIKDKILNYWTEEMNVCLYFIKNGKQHIMSRNGGRDLKGRLEDQLLNSNIFIQT